MFNDNVKDMNSFRNLYFFAGKSGSGKDSIMLGSIQELKKYNIKLHILQRWITRLAHPSEVFKAVTVDEFMEAKKKGKFSLDWYIYGLYFGCPIDLEDYIKKGFIVFINVSRSVLFKVKEKYPLSQIILIETDSEYAINRIKERKRGTDEEIRERIERMNINIKTPDPDLIVRNNGLLDEAIEKVVNFILENMEKRDINIE